VQSAGWGDEEEAVGIDDELAAPALATVQMILRAGHG
jgi:hypothetical protein